jgi:hypothetical protein
LGAGHPLDQGPVGGKADCRARGGDRQYLKRGEPDESRPRRAERESNPEVGLAPAEARQQQRRQAGRGQQGKK